MKPLFGVLLLFSLLPACESQADKCKKACAESTTICAKETDKNARLDCEVKQTEVAFACIKTCEK